MDNDNNNLYQILNVCPDATEDEIKKAYKKKVLKYHPDKSNTKNSHEEFIKLQSAYEVLSNVELRQKYDTTHTASIPDFHQRLYNYFFRMFNDNETKKIFEIICHDEKYIYNIQKNRYGIAFNYLVNKLLDKKENLDIIDDIECDFMDRYNDNYLYISVNRKSRNNVLLYVPLRNDINVFYEEGEIDKYGNKGDLILYTRTINDMGYYIRNGDIYKNLKIRDCDYSENKIIYEHVDGKILKIDKNELMGEQYFIFKNLGFPLENNRRGDLVCELQLITSDIIY